MILAFNDEACCIILNLTTVPRVYRVALVSGNSHISSYPDDDDNDNDDNDNDDDQSGMSLVPVYNRGAAPHFGIVTAAELSTTDVSGGLTYHAHCPGYKYSLCGALLNTS